MKKIPWALTILSLWVVTAGATEQGTVDRCAAIIREFRQLPEKRIPRDVLRHSKGLAIMTVVKAAFIFSAKGGQGVVVARTGHGWSGPSFIGTGGAGWGLQIGAQVSDFVIVLNNDAAVQAFSRRGNVTIGVDVSAAAGPVGRTAAGAVAPTAAVYTYSRSKGLFAGVSLEGAVIARQTDSNFRYSGRPVRADEILTGLVAPPPGAASLRRALGR
jgi:lipid-binding SYLF domain-containing protein